MTTDEWDAMPRDRKLRVLDAAIGRFGWWAEFKKAQADPVPVRRLLRLVSMAEHELAALSTWPSSGDLREAMTERGDGLEHAVMTLGGERLDYERRVADTPTRAERRAVQRRASGRSRRARR